MIVEAPLFGVGLQGKSPNVTANKLINAYFEFQANKDRTQVVIYGTPGLTEVLDQGDTPWRGLRPFGDNLYGVHRTTFYQINNAWVATARGSLLTENGRCDLTDDGTRIVVTDGTEIYVYDTSTPATPIAAVADADRPTSPNTCIFQGGRILTDENDTGQVKGAGLYAPTAWDGLDFATAESNPDKLIRVVNYLGTIVLFGSYTSEFWSNVGGSGFPYARILGVDMEYGLAARWSVGKFAGSYAFLAQNREGQVAVMALNGSQPQRISNNELDHIINNYSNVADATGYGFSLGGHPFYQISFPSAMKSWLYDGSTDYWSELRYGTDGRHRAEVGVDFMSQTIVSDYENGKLYRLEESAYTDNGAEIITVLRGRHIYKDKKNVRIAKLELGIEAGVGTVSGQGVSPVAGLRLSKDGGHTFGTQTFAPMGAVGETTKRCIWRRLGIGRDIVPEVTISDPVKKVITEATLSLDDGST